MLAAQRRAEKDHVVILGTGALLEEEQHQDFALALLGHDLILRIDRGDYVVPVIDLITTGEIGPIDGDLTRLAIETNHDMTLDQTLHAEYPEEIDKCSQHYKPNTPHKNCC